MEIPTTPKCPPKLRNFLERLRTGVYTVRPVGGQGINTSELSGGTLIEATSAMGAGAGGGGLPTPPGGFVILGASGGAIGWYPTVVCQCTINTIDGGGA